VKRIGAGAKSLSDLCLEYGISRPTAYRWLARYREGRGKRLKDRSHRPRRVAGRPASPWLQRLRRLRLRRETWGARKLRVILGERFGEVGLPSVSAMSRWLKQWGLAQGRKRRKPGPLILRAGLTKPKCCHEVWTVDFKGWYRTGDGSRVDPLTVRDLYSRYGIRIGLLADQTVSTARKEFGRIFRKHGLPKRIRCDNGAPFGGGGPTGLTRLSAWWIKLGIGVEFITPGKPGENGSHEQFHKIYKDEVANEPDWDPVSQQRRSTAWLADYNRNRPHESLDQQRPASWYQKSQIRLPRKVASWSYRKGWPRCWVKGNGEISWQGIRRFVGEAFVRDYVGLKPLRRGIWNVYFGPILIGELHEKEKGSIRLAQYRHAK
jgi:putative transposase